MKIINICLLGILLSIDLSARMNPFEPTDTFNEKKSEYLKQLAIQEEKAKAAELEKQKAIAEAMEAKRIEDEVKAKAAELAKIEQAKMEAQKKAEAKAKEEALREAKLQALKDAKLKELAASKENFKPLSFVKVEVYDDTLTIYVDKKYKFLNQDNLPKPKKFVFDFKGDVSFYTVRKTIKHKDFKQFAIGTHRKKKFFRVVVDLSDEIIKYKEIVNSKKGTITIKKVK